MKRLKAALWWISVLLLLWDPVHHGHCSEQKHLDLQNQPQTSSDVPNQQDESEENGGNDKDLLQDRPDVDAVEQETRIHATDTLQTQETTQPDGVVKESQTDEATADPVTLETSVPPEDDAGSLKPDLSSLPSPPITESDAVYISEVLSSTATVSPGPSARSDDSGSSSPVSPVSPTAACEAEENPTYLSDIGSLPMVLENGSTAGTGKSTKPSLGRTNRGTNASSTLKEKIVPATPGRDPAPPPPPDPEDILTFDEWTKSTMEEENEKSQTTHASYNGGSGGVKKVQKTTNYASVECGAKILASNPEAKSTSAILMENVDVYMLNPCSNKIWFVIELCQPIQLKQLDIANFELFSSTPKDFLVSISDRYPTNKWAKLGTFHAREERTVQSFPLDEHLYAKYVKVELLSHFGAEHFCPLSLLRVFGTCMAEELNSELSERVNYQDEDDGISFSLHLNLTETSGTPSKSVMETVAVDQLESIKVIETLSMTEGGHMGPTVPLFSPSISETTARLTSEPDRTTLTKEDQIVTLLPEDESDVQDKSSRSTLQKAEQDSVKAPQDQQC